ncbi:hypothetical protein L1987_77933 [Smallanthus sonchifolius]|uniref:Uncharacterized protein n=1 Tax=Smallanthus sonchifolius TaxID=185202 RepID=A0ACB8ZAF0_9ASTR|nr:hypothetical protein L1987_77933 [Smallanthus sonchifolius]
MNNSLTCLPWKKNKRVVVADRIRKVGAARVLLWEWRRSNVTTEEIQEKQSLEVLLQGVSIEDSHFLDLHLDFHYTTLNSLSLSLSSFSLYIYSVESSLCNTCSKFSFRGCMYHQM